MNGSSDLLTKRVHHQRERPLDFTDFVEIQEAFLKERNGVLERMIVEMKFLSWREPRALRERPLKTPPEPGGCRR